LIRSDQQYPHLETILSLVFMRLSKLWSSISPIVDLDIKVLAAAHGAGGLEELQQRDCGVHPRSGVIDEQFIFLTISKVSCLCCMQNTNTAMGSTAFGRKGSTPLLVTKLSNK
jgi:hypothetical protein